MEKTSTTTGLMRAII